MVCGSGWGYFSVEVSFAPLSLFRGALCAVTFLPLALHSVFFFRVLCRARCRAYDVLDGRAPMLIIHASLGVRM